ncbi:DUF1202 family protein [Pseudocitrobacter corydidari]|uniref:DUF1202 family protein n=1 Tax=Pseudocitrobacter corydidari TaxID=2891570 RepID=A0ABY3SAB7_9ENTR|nr:DUF1202 family protein [Pseudocitrobacter corydidari]UGS43551.1 hypothetical protein G163CM_43260 [Pseudocitrobacter corydidari]
MNGKIFCGVLFSFFLSGCGDNNTPTDEVLKEQVSKQYNGLLMLDKIEVKETSVNGNNRVYAADGTLLMTYDLYKTVASLDNHVVVKKSWDKGQDIKFSATINSVGTKDTGWSTRFSSLQMSVNPEGKPIRDIASNSKYIIAGSSGFDDKIKTIEKEFLGKKNKVDELNKKSEDITNDILKVSSEIDGYWGRSESGAIHSRYVTVREISKEKEEFNKIYAPYVFERKYNEEVFEPAMKARREKLNKYRPSDFDDIRAEKRKVLETYREEYSIKINALNDKISAKVKSLDEGFQALTAKKRSLEQQKFEISNEVRNINYQYENWLEFSDKLQKNKVD